MILSSSFCLRLLPNLALAADMNHATGSQMSIPSVSSCGEVMEEAVPVTALDGQRLVTALPLSDAYDCCSDQEHYFNFIVGQDLSVNEALLAIIPAVDQVINLPIVNFETQVNTLSPPQAEALSSVVKRE